MFAVKKPPSLLVGVILGEAHVRREEAALAARRERVGRGQPRVAAAEGAHSCAFKKKSARAALDVSRRGKPARVVDRIWDVLHGVGRTHDGDLPLKDVGVVHETRGEALDGVPAQLWRRRGGRRGTGRRERRRACRVKWARVGRGRRRGSTRFQAREAGSGERNRVASACSSRVRRATYP